MSTVIPPPYRFSQDTVEAKRRRSIVLIGLQEGQKASKEQCREDVQIAHEVLASIGVDIKPLSVWRLGKKREDGKPRVLRVELNSESSTYRAIGNAKNLKESEKYKGVFLRKSLSVQELEVMRQTRAQLSWLRANHGDTNWVIYRARVWRREEIQSGQMTTVPPLPPLPPVTSSTSPLNLGN
jgi:hypothetical protein